MRNRRGIGELIPDISELEEIYRSGDRDSESEKEMWGALLNLAVNYAIKEGQVAILAHEWLFCGGTKFCAISMTEVCEMTNLDPDYVRRLARKKISGAAGGRKSSHYAKSLRRGREKKIR